MKHLRPPMTRKERGEALGMLARGDRIQDVAYWFGRSPATIHRVKKTANRDDMNVQQHALPPTGPYQLVARQELTVIVEKAAAYDEVAAQGFVVRELERIVKEYKDLVALRQRSTDRVLGSTLSE